MKTADLSGPALDRAVAKAEGLCPQGGHYYKPATPSLAAWCVGPWSPSTNWAQGGPIIEREQITVTTISDGKDLWDARTDMADNSVWGNGPTPLIAAMRCFVASKLGDEVSE